MHDSPHGTQAFTPFGGAYVPEEHGRGPGLGEPAKQSQGRWVVVFIAVLLGATTAAAALTATSRAYAPPPEYWSQRPANFQMKIPGSFWFEDAVY